MVYNALMRALDETRNVTLEDIIPIVEKNHMYTKEVYDDVCQTTVSFALTGGETSRENRVKIAKYIIEHGAPTGRFSNEDKRNAYTWAIDRGEFEFASWVLKHGFDLEEWGPKGSSAAHWAAKRGRIEDLEFMYKKDPDIIVSNDFDNETPLSWAVRGGSLECVKWLVNHKVPVTAKMLEISTRDNVRQYLNTLPTVERLVTKSDDAGNTKLHVAAAKGDDSVVSAMIASGADKNAVNSKKQTPLFLAVSNGRESTVTELLNAHADPNVRTTEGTTALLVAVENRNGQIVENLLKAGAAVNAPNKKGETPLHIAAKNLDQEMISLLIKHRAKLDEKNNEGDTPLHVVLENDFFTSNGCAQVLLDAGADRTIKNKSGVTPDALLEEHQKKVEEMEVQQEHEANMQKMKKVLIYGLVALFFIAVFGTVLGLIIWAATKSDATDFSSSSSSSSPSSSSSDHPVFDFTLATLPCGVTISLLGTDRRFRNISVLSDDLIRCYSNLYDGPSVTPTCMLFRGDKTDSSGKKLIVVSQDPKCEVIYRGKRDYETEVNDKLGEFRGTFQYYNVVDASDVCEGCKKYCYGSFSSDCKNKTSSYYVIDNQDRIVELTVSDVKVSVSYGPAPRLSVFEWEAVGSCKALSVPVDNPCLLISSSSSASSSSGPDPDETWIKKKDITWYDGQTSSTLTTPNQLAGLAYLVNGGNTFEGKTVTLGADIDLSGHYWIPIGLDPSSTLIHFNGIFDGGDHRITNMEIKTENGVRAGLFGYGYQATIKNVAVSGNISATGSSSKFNAGGIVGESSGCSIVNCKSSVDFSISMKVSSVESNAGGIVGKQLNSYVDKCRFDGTLSATTSTNGADVGGIIGYSKNCDVSNCVNTGTVSGCKAAGIVGGCYAGHIYNCYNSGTIIGTEKSKGILSYADYSWDVANCYNVGNASDQQVFSYATYSYGANESDVPVSNDPYKTSCPSCGVFNSSTGSVTSLYNDIIGDCSTLVCALNAWIDEQDDPSLYTRWEAGSQLPAVFVDEN